MAFKKGLEIHTNPAHQRPPRAGTQDIPTLTPAAPVLLRSTKPGTKAVVPQAQLCPVSPVLYMHRNGTKGTFLMARGGRWAEKRVPQVWEIGSSHLMGQT